MVKKVSVVLCTYNGEKYLSEQINSILNQTYPIYELIVQDDCSTDNTLNILINYTKRDSRVKIYTNMKTLGYDANFLDAYNKATGDYIASSDQDDIWKINKIEVLMNSIGDNSLIFHDSILFNSDIYNPIGIRTYSNTIFNETVFMMRPFVAGHQCLFHKEILPLMKMLTQKERVISYDYLICLLGEIMNGVTYINEPLVYWRRHFDAVSYSPSIRQSDLKGFMLAIKSLFIKDRRLITKRYFLLMSNLRFKNKLSSLIIKNMKRGDIVGIIITCFICMKYRNLLFSKGTSCITKSFFMPLYFIRDQSTFIIKD